MAPHRPRIYADFNGLMGSPRDPAREMVPLDTAGSLRDLSVAGVRLREGTRLTIHDASDADEDLEAHATAYYDPVRRWWYAELEHELAYVPARDRAPQRFRCLDCRVELAWPQLPADCPSCGLPTITALAPP